MSSSPAAERAAEEHKLLREKIVRTHKEACGEVLAAAPVPSRLSTPLVSRGRRLEWAISAAGCAHTTSKRKLRAILPGPISMDKRNRALARGGVSRTQNWRNTALWIFRKAVGIKGKPHTTIKGVVLLIGKYLDERYWPATAEVGTNGLGKNVGGAVVGVYRPENLGRYPTKLGNANSSRKPLWKQPGRAKPDSEQKAKEGHWNVLETQPPNLFNRDGNRNEAPGAPKRTFYIRAEGHSKGGEMERATPR